MTLAELKKKQAQIDLHDADKKMTALLSKPTTQIMLNPGAFREDVRAVIAAIVRAVWALTEVPDKTE